MNECLDLFCGLGGWSIGFYREGFQCQGIDIVDVGYPYKLEVCDIRDYKIEPHLFGIRVIVSSPPCTEFSPLSTLSFRRGQRHRPDPEKGIELVKASMKVVNMVKPKFWVLENVLGSIQYLEPILGKPMLVAKPWVLWGSIPPFDLRSESRGDVKLSHTFERGKGGNIFGKGGNRIGLPQDFAFDPLRSWKRARIPVFLSQRIARAIRGAHA